MTIFQVPMALGLLTALLKGITKMTTWQLKITEPSGEIHHFPLQGSVTLGRNDQCNLILKDPTLAQEAAVLWPTQQKASSPFWIRIPHSSPEARLGDLAIREAQLPQEVPFYLGETSFVIEKKEPASLLPAFPSGVRPWLTRSKSGAEVLWMIKKAAETSLSIYLAGETGTGKEVLAHLVHHWSDRKSGPFIPLNCGALPLSLVESELFGHVKGSFTGAVQHRPGAFLQAHGGTLFLDEVGDLPLDIQVKLLRFLENGEIRAVGADRPSRVDVRILCATHKDLHKLVAEGKFRQDLYYRLASIKVAIPPLRSRAEDIELLSKNFVTQFGKSLSHKALLRLQAYSWPGNVRELQHAIERACGLSGPFQPLLSEAAFDFLLTSEAVSEAPELCLGSPVLTLHEMERVLLLKVLRLTGGNRADSAKILGVARSTLFQMLKRHKIYGPRSKRPVE